MKKVNKKFLAPLLAIIMMLSLIPLPAITASAETEGLFNYEVYDYGVEDFGKCAVITGLTDSGYSGELELPSTLGGYPVEIIDVEAFKNCNGITSVTISDGVLLICGDAFSSCTNLISVTIPVSVNRIGDEAFFGCSALTDVYYSGTKEQKKNNISISADYNEDLLKATWHCSDGIVGTFKITYNLNSGKNNAKNPKTFKSDAAVALKNPSRTGYKFAGWYTDAKFQKKVGKIAEGTAKNVTLYAKWSKVTYTITYKLNGGKNNAKNPKSYNITTATITLKNPTKAGYKFGGWYTDAKFKNKITKITKGTAKNITLYAKWTKVTYKITYKLNKGKNGKNPKTYTVTTSTIKLKNATRKGYTFKGWYSDSKFKKKVTKIAKGSTGNKTFYAKWNKK